MNVKCLVQKYDGQLLEVLLLLVLFIYSHNSALVNDVMKGIVIKYCLTNYGK